MPREHEDYRNNLEQLNRLFPDKEMLMAMMIAGIAWLEYDGWEVRA